jgi:hypothetical protein
VVGATVVGTVAGDAVVVDVEVVVVDDVVAAGRVDRVSRVARDDDALHALDATPAATNSTNPR